MAPRTAAWRFASSAKIGLSRVIPLAASLMAGLGVGIEAASVLSVPAMDNFELVVVEAADGAKAVVDETRRELARM